MGVLFRATDNHWRTKMRAFLFIVLAWTAISLYSGHMAYQGFTKAIESRLLEIDP